MTTEVHTSVLVQLTTQLNLSTQCLVEAGKAMEQLEAKVWKLRGALAEIEDWAQSKYDGPEDTRMGWLIARCQDARGR
jgi:hypothetical protein